jgi:MFS family permease
MSATSTDAPGPVAETKPPRLSAFRHRNYRLYFAGQLVSVTGTWMQSLAQAWLVLTLTSSALYFSMVSVLQFAPVLVLGVWAGVIADRYSKRTILLATQTVSALLAGMLALLTATDRVELWQVLALALGLGLVNAFDMPARQSFAVELVGTKDLPNAIALNSTLFNAGRIAGPALAGLILATSGPALCFTLNALSYLAVLAGLLAMRLERRPLASRARGWTQIREGLAYVRATPELMMPVALVFFVAVFGLNFNVWVPLLAKHDFDAGAGGFGLLMSALGAGSLLGALGLALFGRGPRPELVIGAALVLGVSEITLALAAALGAPLPVALLILPLLGLAMSTAGAMANTLVQTGSPDAMRGRVMSVYMTVFAGLSPFGSFLAGGLSEWLGTPFSIGFSGVVMVGSTLVLARRFGPMAVAWRPLRSQARGTAP